MVATVLLIAGTILVTLAVVPYIRGVVQGRTKPRVISWAIWAVLISLMAIVSLQDHQTASAALSIVSTICCASVAILAIRQTSFTLTRLERFTLLGAVLGIGFWLIFKNPMLVLLTAVTVDGIAYLPTFVNGWHNPHDEAMSSYVISAAGSFLVLTAALLTHATVHGLVYPIYSVVFGCIMVGILLTRRFAIPKRAEV